jgi:hypothetical protein
MRSQPKPLFYTFCANVPKLEDHIWNQSDPAHLVLDIRPWLNSKEAAAQCHRTQHGLFMRRHPDLTIRQALRKIESIHRHYPPVDSPVPQDPFARLLIAAGAWSPLPS